jgi:hypothetical protein
MGARRFVRVVVVVLCVLVGALVCGVAGAGAVVSQFGSRGEGAGKFDAPRGVAVDQASGDVYLMDFGNVRIDRFSGEGAFLLAWGWGVADATQGLQTCTATCYHGSTPDYGPGTGEFGLDVRGVAVDNDPLSASYEDVYVPDPGNSRVEKFSSSGSFLAMFGKEVNEDGTNVCVAGEKCRPGKEGAGNGEFDDITGAIAVGPNGDVYVGGDNRVQVFGPEGLFVEQFALATGRTHSIAVDGAGDFYVVSLEPSNLSEYDSSGVLLRTLDGEGGPQAVALDASGDVFVDDLTLSNPVGEEHHLLEFGPGGEELASFDPGTEKLDSGEGIAFGESIGRLYVLNQEVVRVVSVPSPGPELAGGVSVSGIEPLAVTLGATVNPEGNATSYRFEYGLTSSYGSSAPSPEGSLPASFNGESVSVTVAKLVAGMTYHYRVVATDSKGHTTVGPDATFTTQPAVLIDSEYATNVASTSATLGGELNPLGAQATYHVEYDTSEYTQGGPAHGTSLPEGSLGSGLSDVPVGAHIDNLLPGTLYHYRIVAHDTREGVPYTVEGPDQAFVTQMVGSGLTVADSREWEMVTPPDKQGAQVYAIGQYSGEGAVIEASAGGDALTYVTSAPTELEPHGYTNLQQAFAVRGSAGWGSHDIGLSHETETGTGVGSAVEYRFFAEDLSLAAVQPFGRFTPSLSSEASEETSYIRTDYSGGDVSDRCESSCYRPLVTGKTGYANVPPGTIFGSEGKCLEIGCGPRFVDATSDLAHVILSSRAQLTSIPTKGAASLYEWSAGKLAMVSILPSGEADSSSRLGASGMSNSRRAVSADGSRVVWSGTSGHLYMRDMVREETVQLDLVRGGSGEGGVSPQFGIASRDGSRVFFTDSQTLTADSAAEGGGSDLYECEMIVVAGKLGCRLSDLTPGVSADVVGLVLGASEDGSWVYFVADGVLAPGAVQGTCLSELSSADSLCNVYVRHDGMTSLVAVVSGADEPDWELSLPYMTARVSPDGQWLAFMSQRDLTGYDTRDAVSGKPDEEVYLYHADAGFGHLVCASCDPSGARPVGLLDPGDGLTLGDRVWSLTGRPVASNIPGYTPMELGDARYQSRYLSDGGRLFFNSDDALVAQDVNGTEDVYQYEPPGVGGCTSGSVTFSARSGGCVGLISSGSSAEESGFLDASATGGDVFFLTTARLSGVDRDTALDIYDAHECSGGSPCFAQPPVQPPVCDTGDSCKTAPSPQPGIFGAPASATFTGSGNVRAPVSKRVVRSRGLTRAQKLSRSLRVCQRMKGKHRTACVRRAKTRFGGKKSSRTSAIGRGGR